MSDLRDLIARSWCTICYGSDKWSTLTAAQLQFWRQDVDVFLAATTAAGFAIVPREPTRDKLAEIIEGDPAWVDGLVEARALAERIIAFLLAVADKP